MYYDFFKLYYNNLNVLWCSDNLEKNTINNFYWLPATQNKVKLMEFYEENIKETRIKTELLSELKEIAYETLNIENEKHNLSGELRILLAKWIIKQPSLINNNEQTI